jgi:hypothetical protein
MATGKVVGEFKSLSEAAKAVAVSRNTLHNATKKRQHACGGFFWRRRRDGPSPSAPKKRRKKKAAAAKPADSEEEDLEEPEDEEDEDPAADSKQKAAAASQDDKEYTVERLVSHRKRKSQTEYLVKWEGYSADENTWESLGKGPAVAAYWRAVGGCAAPGLV